VGPTLSYESRQDARAREVAALWRRQFPPRRGLRITACVGIAAMLWGGACLPGGYCALFAGIVFASVGAVPVLIWQLGDRPAALRAGLPAPPVLGGWWILLAFLLVPVGHLTRANGRILATFTRHALAPTPSTLVLGPYIVANARVTPLGIQGNAPGGGRITVTWNETDGYRMEANPLN